MRPDCHEPQVPSGRRDVWVTRARAFGERAEDLDVDFSRLPRPVLVGEILKRCLPALDDGLCDECDIQQWTLDRRLQGLLAVAAAGGTAALTTRHRCAHCDETLEIPLDLANFARDEAAADFDATLPSGERLCVSLPTGHHQQHWLRKGDVTIRGMARDLVRSIDGEHVRGDWEVPEDWLEFIAGRLEQHDPLTALELLARCPECDAEATIAFDLEALLLEQLQSRQMQILREIHLLASGYHWSEREILGMPAWRRRHYLGRFGADVIA